MNYEIIYNTNKLTPFGIRDKSGYLIFFVHVNKYIGQEERYAKEVSEQVELANYLLKCLNERSR